MKNGDPYRYIDTGKKAMIMLDGYVAACIHH